MLKGFKTFLLRGNVVDLAVAVVIGGAFGAVVAALVKDLLTPLIAAIVGKPDFSAIAFTVNGSKFLIGDFINAVVAFVLVAAAIYFFVVLPMNMVMERRRRGEAPADPTTKKCPECLSEVPIAARRCAFCTQSLEVAGVGRAHAIATSLGTSAYCEIRHEGDDGYAKRIFVVSRLDADAGASGLRRPGRTREDGSGEGARGGRQPQHRVGVGPRSPARRRTSHGEEDHCGTAVHVGRRSGQGGRAEEHH